MTNPFTGAGVALITPFHADKSIDFDALGNLIENQINGGMDYLVALGTTAETPTLSDSEKQEITEFIKKKNAGRLPLMIGMGGNDPVKVVESIRKTNFDGIDAILSVTPYYNRPSQEGLFQHFKMIVEASPVPVILYNVPGRTGVNMEADTTLRIARLSEKVIGIKEASGDLSQFARMIKYAPEHFKVISGDDALTFPSVVLGAVGVISVIANALPEKLSNLTHAALNGKNDEAAQLHLQLAEILKLIFKEGNPAGIKALMEMMGTAQNYLRLPLVPVSQATYELIGKELKTLS
jgi:4-hydroxy-tetrahydrodipicolinate synthase